MDNDKFMPRLLFNEIVDILMNVVKNDQLKLGITGDPTNHTIKLNYFDLLYIAKLIDELIIEKRWELCTKYIDIDEENEIKNKFNDTTNKTIYLVIERKKNNFILFILREKINKVISDIFGIKNRLSEESKPIIASECRNCRYGKEYYIFRSQEDRVENLLFCYHNQYKEIRGFYSICSKFERKTK